MKNKKLYLIVVILCITILILSVAFTLISTKAYIKLKKSSSQLWNISFVSGNYPGTKLSSSSENLVCGIATANFTNVTVSKSNFTTTGDGCVYELTLQNTGTIDASLAIISAQTPDNSKCKTKGSNMVCDSITYKITRDKYGNKLLDNNSVLPKNTSMKVYLTVLYNGSNTENIIQSGAGFNLIYVEE